MIKAINILICCSLLFSDEAKAQTNEVWYSGTDYFLNNIQEARDYGIWTQTYLGLGASNGSLLTKKSPNGLPLLEINFDDFLITTQIYEYGNGNLFLDIATRDAKIKSRTAAGFMILDSNGEKIKEHLYIPHPDSVMPQKLALGFGQIMGIIPVEPNNPETDLILLGYSSIGWDDPEHPASEDFLGSLIGLERIDAQGNRLWTKRIHEVYNWGLPTLIPLDDGNFLMTTNAVVYPNAPSDSTFHRDGVVMIKYDMDGNKIWRNNTLLTFDGELKTTKPKEPFVLPSGHILVPLGLAGPSNTWRTAMLKVSPEGETEDWFFVGDTSRSAGNSQARYLDTNRLVFVCNYSSVQDPSDPFAKPYNVFVLDTLGNTQYAWEGDHGVWSVNGLCVPENKQSIYASPAKWYSGGSSTKILKFQPDLSPFVYDSTAYSFDTAQNQAFDGLFITLDYYDFLDSLNSIGLPETEIENSLNIYPNPCSSHAYIHPPEGLAQAKLQLYDALGNLLYSAHWSGESAFQLPVAKLASGSYFVQVFSGVEVYSASLVVRD